MATKEKPEHKMMEGPVHPGGGLGPAREDSKEKVKEDAKQEGNNDHDQDGA